MMRGRVLATIVIASALTLSACTDSGQSDARTNVEFPTLDFEGKMQETGDGSITRMASASVPDCGQNFLVASFKLKMTVTNYTDRDLMLFVPDVECTDWFGTLNPYQLANQVLKPGQSFGPVTLEGSRLARNRAFDLDFFDCSNGPIGAPFCTIGGTRPNAVNAKITCNEMDVSDGGWLICDGHTFCGKDSPNFQEQTDTATLNRVWKYQGISYPSEPVAPNPPLQLTVTTLCTADSATLAITQ
jgi:hypothetical protein